jgi:Na+-translocating ferredoxin:NAD+ oxidoreductase RnfG subunit
MQTIRRAAGQGFAKSRLAARLASRLALVAAAVSIAGIGPGAGSVAHAKVFASQKQALEEAFPEATHIERRTFLLRAEQVEQIEELSGRAVDAKVVVLHVARREDEILGFAEIAVHVVRTQPEAMLIALSPEGSVRSVRVIAFHEPLDYLPTPGWYAQLEGKRKGDSLRLGREIHGVVGATLSAQAAVDGVRRMLAYFEVLLRPAYGSGAGH